jgi:hypothetical protein
MRLSTAEVQCISRSGKPHSHVVKNDEILPDRDTASQHAFLQSSNLAKRSRLGKLPQQPFDTIQRTTSDSPRAGVRPVVSS